MSSPFTSGKLALIGIYWRRKIMPSAPLQFCIPGAVGGVLVGDTCQSKQVKLLHVQQLSQSSSLWDLWYQGLFHLTKPT